MAAFDNSKTRRPAPGGTSELPGADSALDAFHDMAELREQVYRVATQDITVLLAGETGTGKTRLARLIHHLSPRSAEPFLVIDCGALSANLIESEMFGHVKGAFTGAERERVGKLAVAGKGTLLLDEINSLPLPLQAKLLRAVEDRVFEPVGSNKPQPLQARLIAASNAPLDQEMTAGRFRPDLYYRLNVIAFYLPPLRDRRGTVPGLALKFLSEFVARNRPDVRGLTPEARAALEGYGWPGNIRELRNVLERAVALCRGPDVEVRDLPENVWRARPAQGPEGPQAGAPALPEPYTRPQGTANNAPLTLTQSREEAEIHRIKAALEKNGNNRLRAAAELGISRMGLYKKLHKYRLTDDAEGPRGGRGQGVRVLPGGPAAKGGLMDGDVLTEVAGRPIRGPGRLQQVVAGLTAGKQVEVSVARDGARKVLTVEALPEGFGLAAEVLEPRATTLGKVGVKVMDVTPKAAREFGHPEKSAGALITEIAPDSAAAAGGRNSGAVILQVDR
jgi:DNA-binding NtrC family response regulator